MPDIPYLIVHGDKDTSVAKERHSDRLVAAMRRRKMKVEYIEVPGMGHGGPVPVEVIRREVDFVASVLARNAHSDLPF
jgi:dipeptidyl aminopeptidase/acylaminoacyl peptidase